MESRWTSGCVRCPAQTQSISPHLLASSTNIFSRDFIRSLSNDLEFNRDQLASELGFSAKCLVADGLYNWCNSPGSTVFVLVSVLGNLGRADCVQRIDQYMQSNTMQLFVKVEVAASEGLPTTTAAGPKFHQVVTSCDFSLLQALENILGHNMVFYEIVGPGSWVMWTTSAKELKGQQLTLLYHNQPVPQTRAALCGDTKEPDTELKQPIVTQNIPANSSAISDEETHLKVLGCTEIESLKYSQEPSIQVSNSNNATLSGSLDMDRINLGSLSAEGPTKTHSYPSLNSKEYIFTSEHQTQVKTLIDGKQNTPEYAQVVKHFPDKLLYKDSNSNARGSPDLMVHPLEILDNVPHLSLLEEDFSSLLTNTQRPSLQSQFGEKQYKMNNLNCVTSAKNSMYAQTVTETSVPKSAAPTSVIRPAHKLPQSFSGSTAKVSDTVIKTPALPQTNMSELETSNTASSSLKQGRNDQHMNVPTFLTGHNFLSNTCLQSVGKNSGNNSRTLEKESYLPCGNYGLSVTPPQKRHRLNDATSDSLIQADQHLPSNDQLQQQTLLDVQSLKLKKLQLQHQQGITSSQATTNHHLTSAINSQDHPSWTQQRQCQIHQDSQPYQELHDESNYSGRNSPDEHSGNWSHMHQEMEHQTIHPMAKPQHKFEYHQQLRSQLCSEPEKQLSNFPFLESNDYPFLNSNASPFLMCHTPPPGFPEEEVEKENLHVFEVKQQQNIQSEIFDAASLNQGTSPASHFVRKLGQVTKMDTRQYMTMTRPTQNGFGNPSMKSLPVKPQNVFGQFTTLHNFELTGSNLMNPQTFLTSGNHFRSAFGSGSSGISVDCHTSTQDEPSAVFTEPQSSFMCPQPFYPAPPLFDALGRHINTSMMPQDEALRDTLAEAAARHQEGYSSANKGQFTRSRSLSTNHFQTMPITPVLSLEAELLRLDGWCPNENGDTIQHTMEKFWSQDGNYIIWKSRRYKKLVITVSHLNQLFHFRVEENNPEDSNRKVYFLFQGGYSSDSLLDLVHHYRQNGIRITMQSKGNKKTYIEMIQLRCPLKVKTEMKRKDTSRSK